MNLNTRMMNAIRALSSDANWMIIREELAAHIGREVYKLLTQPIEKRDETLGYMRGQNDLFVAFEAASTGVHANKVEMPALPISATKAGKKSLIDEVL